MKATIQIPQSLNEVTLAQYQQFLKIPESDPFKREKLVSIFLNLDFKWVRAIKKDQLDEIVLHLENLLNADQELIRTFRIGDMQFGLIPKFDDMTFGEYIDLDKYMSDWNTMHKAMSVLYRPIITKQKDNYIIQPYEGSNDAMQYMPLDVALSAMLFFYRLKNDLLAHIPNSLLKMAQEILAQKHSSHQNGDGTKASMRSQEGTLPSSIKLPKQAYMSA
jgi:transcriptional regulator NrdR family protein